MFKYASHTRPLTGREDTRRGPIQAERFVLFLKEKTMKKVIYMPRNKGTGSFNVQLDPAGGSYLDWQTSYINDQGYPVQAHPFIAPVVSAGGGRVNFVNMQTSANNVIVQSTLECFPEWQTICNLINAVNNGSHISSTHSLSFGSPFYQEYPSDPWGMNRIYAPSIDTVNRQHVVACFNNVDCTDGNNNWTENIAFRVNYNHFSTTYGVARDRRFFTEGAFGGGYPNNPSVNYWETLVDVLNNGLNTYTNGATPDVVAASSESYKSRLTFFNFLGATNQVNMHGLTYYFQNMPLSKQTVEGAGYDVNSFNAVINI